MVVAASAHVCVCVGIYFVSRAEMAMHVKLNACSVNTVFCCELRASPFSRIRLVENLLNLSSCCYEATTKLTRNRQKQKKE